MKRRKKAVELAEQQLQLQEDGLDALKIGKKPHIMLERSAGAPPKMGSSPQPNSDRPVQSDYPSTRARGNISPILGRSLSPDYNTAAKISSEPQGISSIIQLAKVPSVLSPEGHTKIN